jgi:hypothetical protein
MVISFKAFTWIDSEENLIIIIIIIINRHELGLNRRVSASSNRTTKTKLRLLVPGPGFEIETC